MIDSLFYPMLANTLLVSVVILLMAGFGQLIKRHYVPKFRYVVGIILAVRLLVPLQIPLPADIAPPVQLPRVDRQETSVETVQTEQEPIETPKESGLMERKWNVAVILHSMQLLWAAGILIFLLVSGLRYGWARYCLRRWRLPADAELEADAAALREEMGIRQNVQVYFSGRVDSPMLVGLFRPAVYLPRGVLFPAEIRLVLRHELTHCKRRDLWCKLLLLAANAVHWFNPLVYVLRRRMDNDMEMICDGEVVKPLTDDQRHTYAEAMLAVMKQKLNPALRVGARFLGSPQSMRERFENILYFKIKKRGYLMELLIAVMMICGSFGCTSPDAGSIGIIGGADGPTSIYVSDEGLWKNNEEQALHTAVLTENSGGFFSGECKTTAVHVLRKESTEEGYTFYCLTQYGEFGFENGYFTKVSGTGTIPVRMQFDKNMNLTEYKEPMDGSYYAESIREMFPADLQAAAITPAEAVSAALNAQEMEYAKAYLRQIGREAEVVYNWRLEKGSRLAEMDVEISNLLLDKFHVYPYWIGTLEKVENGVRYVYEKSWAEEGKGAGVVTFTKYVFDTQEVISKQAYLVNGSSLTPLDGAAEIK